MKLSSLASSSEGNCIYVGTKKTNVLVDCGVSAKRIENSLSELDLTVPEFDGILITHEHLIYGMMLQILFVTRFTQKKGPRQALQQILETTMNIW